MDVTTAIRTRRSVRRYKKKDIPDNVLREILEAARLAPSAANRQAWELIVVKDPELKARLVPLCKNQKFVEECSVFLIALRTPAEVEPGGRDHHDGPHNLAPTEGLGTCWIGAFDGERWERPLVFGNRLVTCA